MALTSNEKSSDNIKLYLTSACGLATCYKQYDIDLKNAL